MKYKLIAFHLGSIAFRVIGAITGAILLFGVFLNPQIIEERIKEELIIHHPVVALVFAAAILTPAYYTVLKPWIFWPVFTLDLLFIAICATDTELIKNHLLFIVSPAIGYFSYRMYYLYYLKNRHLLKEMET